MYSVDNPALLGNTTIEAMTSQSFEQGYVYRVPGTTSRITLFQKDLDDLIVVRSSVLTNSGGARLQGMELERELSQRCT